MKNHFLKTRAVALLMLTVLSVIANGCQLSVTLGKTQHQVLSPSSLSQVSRQENEKDVHGSKEKNVASKIEENPIGIYKPAIGISREMQQLSRELVQPLNRLPDYRQAYNVIDCDVEPNLSSIELDHPKEALTAKNITLVGESAWISEDVKSGPYWVGGQWVYTIDRISRPVTPKDTVDWYKGAYKYVKVKGRYKRVPFQHKE